MKEIKVTEEELKYIRGLRIGFQQVMAELGQIELQLYDLKNALGNINDEKDKRLTKYEELKKQERIQLEMLNKKYGAGNLNIENGTFIPVEDKIPEDTQESSK